MQKAPSKIHLKTAGSFPERFCFVVHVVVVHALIVPVVIVPAVMVHVVDAESCLLLIVGVLTR